MNTLIDVAGATSGGADRWRRELVAWTSRELRDDVRVVGATEMVAPSWLARRELLGWSDRRIAANNVSFVGGRGRRVVLLRNALHFLVPGEEARIPRLPAGVRRQIPVVRAAALRADILVAPCNDMAERVSFYMPRVQRRLRVRHHPLTPSKSSTWTPDRRFILFPCLPSPHKDCVGALCTLVESIERSGEDLLVLVTVGHDCLGRLAGSAWVKAIGPQTPDQMEHLWTGAAAVYAPFETESFGYPVAEGRAYGVSVIGRAGSQYLEIGGPALHPFDPAVPDSLVDAVLSAVSTRPQPDPTPFDPDSYFRWLTTV